MLCTCGAITRRVMHASPASIRTQSSRRRVSNATARPSGKTPVASSRARPSPSVRRRNTRLRYRHQHRIARVLATLYAMQRNLRLSQQQPHRTALVPLVLLALSATEAQSKLPASTRTTRIFRAQLRARHARRVRREKYGSIAREQQKGSVSRAKLGIARCRSFSVSCARQAALRLIV